MAAESDPDQRQVAPDRCGLQDLEKQPENDQGDQGTDQEIQGIAGSGQDAQDRHDERPNQAQQKRPAFPSKGAVLHGAIIGFQDGQLRRPAG
jgi:hypothetical protein